jgi:hypothetical protein
VTIKDGEVPSGRPSPVHTGEWTESEQRIINNIYWGSLRALGRTEEENDAVINGAPVTISLRLRWWRRRMKARFQWK